MGKRYFCFARTESCLVIIDTQHFMWCFCKADKLKSIEIQQNLKNYKKDWLSAVIYYELPPHILYRDKCNRNKLDRYFVFEVYNYLVGDIEHLYIMPYDLFKTTVGEQYPDLVAYALINDGFEKIYDNIIYYILSRKQIERTYYFERIY